MESSERLVRYLTDEQPEVEVLWDERWCFGLLAEWRRAPSGRWIGLVRFNVRPGENRIEVFDQNRIRRYGSPSGSPSGLVPGS